MNDSEKLKAIATLFHERFLDDKIQAQGCYDVVALVHDYINYNEPQIAFDILCQQLYEYTIPITYEEYRSLTEILHILDMKSNNSYIFLDELVVDNRNEQ